MVYGYCRITVSAILKNTAVVMWEENKRIVVSIVENTLCLLERRYIRANGQFCVSCQAESITLNRQKLYPFCYYTYLITLCNIFYSLHCIHIRTRTHTHTHLHIVFPVFGQVIQLSISKALHQHMFIYSPNI